MTMRLKKKLIKIREVVNNSIKKKECGEQSNIKQSNINIIFIIFIIIYWLISNVKELIMLIIIVLSGHKCI